MKLLWNWSLRTWMQIDWNMYHQQVHALYSVSKILEQVSNTNIKVYKMKLHNLIRINGLLSFNWIRFLWNVLINWQ